MSVKKDNFIKKAIKVWGYKYDYSRVEYIDYKTPIIIGYKGEWYNQTPNKHLQCKKIEDSFIKLTTEEFISRSKNVWGDRFEYTECVYDGINSKVKLFDKLNERWVEQVAKSHLNGNSVIRLTRDLFIRRCNMVHNYRYSYDKIEYDNMNSLITVVCPLHGDFELKAVSHVNGSMCSECRENSLQREISHFLDKRNITFNKNHTFENCRYEGEKITYTYYIPSMRTVIIHTDVSFYTPVGYYDILNDILRKQLEYCEDNYLNVIIVDPKTYNHIHKYLYDNLKIFL